MFNQDKPETNGKQMLRPAIVIGPGGTGNQVARRLNKLFRDHYGDAPMLIHFLVADTDAGTFSYLMCSNQGGMELKPADA